MALTYWFSIRFRFFFRLFCLKKIYIRIDTEILMSDAYKKHCRVLIIFGHEKLVTVSDVSPGWACGQPEGDVLESGELF